MRRLRKISHYFTIGIVAILGLGLSSYSASAVSLSRSSCVVHDLAIYSDFLELVKKHRLNKNGDFYETLRKSPDFSSFLGRKNLTWKAELSETEKTRIATDYLKGAFSRYEGASLAQMQDDSLKRALLAHGTTRRGLTGRETLERLSAENKNRILKERSYQSKPEMKEAEQIVEQISLQFTHNSRMLHEQPVLPVLSSRQLEGLGLQGGLNTRYLNKEILKTDDNVFFHLKPVRKDMKTSAGPDEYGSDSSSVKDAYAKENGWVSVFVMYPWELLSFGEKYSAAEASIISKEILRKHKKPALRAYKNRSKATQTLGSMNDEEKDKISREFKDTFSIISKQLNLFDFTANDFKNLIHTQLLFELDHLRINSPRKFKEYVDTLTFYKNPIEIDRALEDLVFTPLGIPYHYELKIPVGVPADQIRE